MIEAKPLLQLEGVRHGFFTRRGGVSTGIYDSLNCGVGSRDDPVRVAGNRERVAASLGVAADRLVTPYQVHSPTAVVATDFWERSEAPKAVTAMRCMRALIRYLSRLRCPATAGTLYCRSGLRESERHDEHPFHLHHSPPRNRLSSRARAASAPRPSRA